MTWTVPAPQLLDDGPLVGDDRPLLEGALAGQRATLVNICVGLTAEQLVQRAVPPSNLSLLGIVRHMAKVERVWFRERIGAEQVDPMYEPALGKDTDFDDVRSEHAEAAFRRLTDEWSLADRAAAAASFDHTIEVRGQVLSLRMVYVHMISEYARHNGHADLLRERIDGQTGH